MPLAADSNLRSPAAVARFSLAAVLGLGLDLWTKHLAVMHLKPDGPLTPPEVIRAIPGLLHLTYVENHGAVFGLGQGMRWFFLAVSVVAVVVLTGVFARCGRHWLLQVLLGLMLAGVVGNLIDRALYGYVRDMFHMLPGWTWPAAVQRLIPALPAEVFPWVFNVADSFLSVGVTVLLIRSLFQSSQPPPPVTSEPADARG